MQYQPMLNSVTENLPPYPMEELKKIKQSLAEQGQEIFDFGTGDPRIPLWEPICGAIRDSIGSYSQYPGITGTPELRQAQRNYMLRRYNLTADSPLETLPVRGSKEAIFHMALSVVGRCNGRKKILYPDPGYPVYRSSTLFAGGIPVPCRLKPESGYLLEPWKLPAQEQEGIAALWVNYPHNPTGTMAPASYWEELIAWCHKKDVLLLADDCYADIYDISLDGDSSPDQRPLSPVALSTDRVLSFMSLSKRSGLTGYRLGFIAGDPGILKAHARARANFGLASPELIQNGGVVAWNDDAHVKRRREIFSGRMAKMGAFLLEKEAIASVPKATFYLWCRVPESFGQDDVSFCLKLAKSGVIASPSSWLSEGLEGYFRLAMVPDEAAIEKAMDILNNYL